MRAGAKRSERLTRRLLETNDLTVGELAAVVNEAHRALEAANFTRALVRLGDLSTVNLDGDGVRAGIAAEERWPEGASSVRVDAARTKDDIPSFMSGMMGVARMTRPLMQTILSISASAKRRVSSHVSHLQPATQTYLGGSAPSC